MNVGIINKTSNVFTKPDNVKYLYHLTSRKNYLKMGVSGEVKASMDGCFNGKNNLKGVFLFDLPNFIRNWRRSKDWRGNLGLSLIQQAAKGCNDIVCIRVPINAQQQQKLLGRSQNKLFEFLRFGKGSKQHAMHGDKIKDINPETLKNDAMEFINPENISWDDIEYVGSANVKKVRAKLPQNATPGQWVETTLKELFSKLKDSPKIE